MLFMLNTRPKAGATREELVARLTQRLNPATWDLIRYGILSHVLYRSATNRAFSQCSTRPPSRRLKRWWPAAQRGSRSLIWRLLRSISFHTSTDHLLLRLDIGEISAARQVSRPARGR